MKCRTMAAHMIDRLPTNTQLVTALSPEVQRSGSREDCCVSGGGGRGFGGFGSGPMAAQRLQLKVTWCDLTHSHPHLKPEEKFSITRCTTVHLS